jgi:hypothetical protein
MLRSAAVEQGMPLSGDDRIGECNAAQLLGLEVETLAKRRAEGRAPLSRSDRRLARELSACRPGRVDRVAARRFLTPFPHQAG